MVSNVEGYPILQAVEKSGGTLAPDTQTWMKKWLGMDLERTDRYRFSGLTGSTSVNLNIDRVTAGKTANVPDPLGIFLASNSSGNPTTELAYFNLSAILGWDSIFRPAARYELGAGASQRFLTLIQAAKFTDPQQIGNAKNITALIQKGGPLLGCLKAQKDPTNTAVDSMCDFKLGDNGGPNFTSPVTASLQITNAAPASGAQITLLPGYVGDALELAKEYSVIMTLDVIFQQGDRYSGGNLVIRKDSLGQAHFYATDNGGAYIQDDISMITTQLGWFSRYDRRTIDSLRLINNFLRTPKNGFLGYKDAQAFIIDLGLYFEMTPAQFVANFQRNIHMLLDKVDSVVAQYGDAAYLDNDEERLKR